MNVHASSIISVPLAGAAGLLLVTTLFLSGAQSSQPSFKESGSALPRMNPTYVQTYVQPYVQASTVTTIAPSRDWTLEDPLISAEAALVIDDVAGTARPLYIIHGTTVRPLASIVKLLTALTVLTRLDPNDEVRITREDIAAPENNGGLIPGETLTVRDLLAALLIESSNDAAHALARVGGDGSIDAFVVAMNEQAQHIGLHSLTVNDPMGLSDTTKASPLDVARLLQKAVQHPALTPILSSWRYDTPTHTFLSTHGLFSIFDTITGSKTGFTDEAGQNLVLQRRLSSGRVITSVVMGSQDRERDTVILHRWAEKAFYYNE